MVVSAGGLVVPAHGLDDAQDDEDPDPGTDVSFDVAQHLVSAAAGEPTGMTRGWRARLDQVLEKISGPPPSR